MPKDSKDSESPTEGTNTSGATIESSRTYPSGGSTSMTPVSNHSVSAPRSEMEAGSVAASGSSDDTPSLTDDDTINTEDETPRATPAVPERPLESGDEADASSPEDTTAARIASRKRRKSGQEHSDATTKRPRGDSRGEDGHA